MYGGQKGDTLNVRGIEGDTLNVQGIYSEVANSGSSPFPGHLYKYRVVLLKLKHKKYLEYSGHEL